MAYVKTVWVDDGPPAISAANLNHLEQGVYDAHVTADGAIQKSLVDAAGDLLIGSGADALTRLAKGANGQALVVDGSGNVAWGNVNVSDIAYVEFTNSVALTTAVADVVSSGAISYAATPIWIEFFAPRVIFPNGAAGIIHLELWDGATELGRLGEIGFNAWGSGNLQPVTNTYAARKLTPTAASHTYKVRAKMSASTGTIAAGAGGAGVLLPGYIRVRPA